MPHVRERRTIGSTAGEIERIESRLISELSRLGYDDSAVFAVRLGFQEAANNARMHGNRDDPSKRIHIELDLDQVRAVIDVRDEGAGFDPATVPDPTRDENIEIPAGRGLTLIRAFMTEVEIIPPGNRIRMKYVK